MHPYIFMGFCGLLQTITVVSSTLNSTSEFQRSVFYDTVSVGVDGFWEYIRNSPAKSRFDCLVQCRNFKECFSIYFNLNARECYHLKPQTLWSVPFQVPPNETVTRNMQAVDVKVVVFRASSGGGINFFQAWEDDTYVSATTDGATDLSKKITYTYKHPFLKYWSSINIKQVDVTLWDEGNKVVHLEFDGRASTSKNWFAYNRILLSSFTDLESTPAAYVDADGEYGRRFYIRRTHLGCDGDVGWMCLKDDINGCDWEIHPPGPAFIYSKTKSAIFWTNNPDMGLADDFFVTIVLGL